MIMPLFRRRTPPAPVTPEITSHREDPFGWEGRWYVFYRGFTIEQNGNHCCVRPTTSWFAHKGPSSPFMAIMAQRLVDNLLTRQQ